MARRPVVLVVAFERPFSKFAPRGGVFMSQDRVCFGTLCDPVNLIPEKLNAIPLLVPTHCRSEDVPQLLKMADGLLLPGGDSNVQPALYKHANCPKTEQVFDPHRDRLEHALLNEAFRLKKPVLGICRGMQMINVWRGGTLNQSFPPDHHVNHMVSAPSLGKGNNPEDNHTLKIAPNSKLAQWLGNTRDTVVNSIHEQSINTLGYGLAAEAYAEDGVVEAFRLTDPDIFMYGMQWHPDFNAEQPASKAVLNAFKKSLQAQITGGNWLHKLTPWKR